MNDTDLTLLVNDAKIIVGWFANKQNDDSTLAVIRVGFWRRLWSVVCFWRGMTIDVPVTAKRATHIVNTVLSLSNYIEGQVRSRQQAPRSMNAPMPLPSRPIM